MASDNDNQSWLTRTHLGWQAMDWLKVDAQARHNTADSDQPTPSLEEFWSPGPPACFGFAGSGAVWRFAAFVYLRQRCSLPVMFPKLCAGLGWLSVALSLTVIRARCADLSAGRSAYDKACAHCHGNDGAGWPEKNGPTLHDTDWVTGDPDRLIRITLGGLYLRIPLKNGTHYGGMTGAKDQLNDREVAAVLTYIRQSWGNAASAIEPAQVAKLRPEVDARKLPYFAKDFGLKAEPKFGPNGEALEPPDPFAAGGFKTYTLICQNCHQPDGRGMVTEDGHGYPPLAGSAYVTGSKRRLVRIVLGGMQGPVVVKGKTFSEVMPPWHVALDDTQIAQVLTFIRQSWMNLEPRISPALVKELRKESEQRAGVPWSAGELDQLDAREAAQARAAEAAQ